MYKKERSSPRVPAQEHLESCVLFVVRLKTRVRRIVRGWFESTWVQRYVSRTEGLHGDSKYIPLFMLSLVVLKLFLTQNLHFIS